MWWSRSAAALIFRRFTEQECFDHWEANFSRREDMFAQELRVKTNYETLFPPERQGWVDWGRHRWGDLACLGVREEIPELGEFV